MAENATPGRAPAPADPAAPSQLAELQIEMGPWKGHGWVPPDQVNHLITMAGILGSTVSGLAAVVYTLRVNPRLTDLAFAELLLALVTAVLIAAAGRAVPKRRKQTRKGSKVRASSKKTA
jgi:hypothetical protein